MDFPRHLKGKKLPNHDTAGTKEILPIEIRANFHKYRAGRDKFVLFVPSLWNGLIQ
jgi:hypothetical protein